MAKRTKTSSPPGHGKDDTGIPAAGPLETAADGSRWRGPDVLRPLLVPLERLRPDPRNARSHDERSYEGIRTSLRKFGQRKVIVVDADGIVVAGNGQLEAARREGWTHLAVADTSGMTAEDVRAFAVADNRTAELSEWDFDALSAELGAFDAALVEAIGFTPLELDQMAAALEPPASGGEPGATYTAKITSPVYEPRGEKPEASELFDRAKTSRLILDIEKAKLPRDVDAFLRAAAERHTVFDFRRIADFYAHSEPVVQRLFERSALVIIDFHQAIEFGYVRVSTTIAGLADAERAAVDAGLSPLDVEVGDDE